MSSISFNCVSLINISGQLEIFAFLYLAPAFNIPAKCDLIDQFQDAIVNLIFNCGWTPQIYIGTDLNIDIDANNQRDNTFLEHVSQFQESLAREDMLRIKYT